MSTAHTRPRLAVCNVDPGIPAPSSAGVPPLTRLGSERPEPERYWTNASSKALPGARRGPGSYHAVSAEWHSRLRRPRSRERRGVCTMARMPACEAERPGSLLRDRDSLGRRTMNPILTAMLLCGLAAAALSGCYVVSPYAYPAAYPSPYPTPYMPPSSGGPPPPRPGDPTTGPPPSSATPRSAPGAAGAPQGPAQNCQTVTVEGHYETHSKQSGQRETIWIATRTEQICQ